ncbi:MAG TPA: ribosome small subunit-dependent GTPase A [candidate division Zixibacteria bacterium]|jgi:ribosome biogenesis GTPase
MNDDSRQLQGRVIQSYGNRYVVQSVAGTYDCGLRGRLRLSDQPTRTPVAVGDHVIFATEGPGIGMIEEVEERRNRISRPDVIKPGQEQVLVANCDQLVVVASVSRPKLKLGAIDRFLLIAERERMTGVVVINKSDLASKAELDHALGVYNSAGYPALATSAVTGDGLEELRRMLTLKTSILAGHSGVGKSSLVMALDPTLNLRTAAVSEATGKGSHTTTTVRLFPLRAGGYIADMPGLRVIGLWGLTPEELPGLFPEFASRAHGCKFHNCMHIGEPQCAVAAALASGEIRPERHQGYLRIRESLIMKG